MFAPSSVDRYPPHHDLSGGDITVTVGGLVVIILIICCCMCCCSQRRANTRGVVHETGNTICQCLLLFCQAQFP